MTETLRISSPAEGVRLVEMNRPERRNAMNVAMYRGLVDALGAAEADDGVRAVVIAGVGGVFTAGNDLADFQTRQPGEVSIAITFLRTLVDFAKPLVAGVEGFAVGIGTTMLLHCDLAFAGRAARFRMPFVPLGLCPEGASSVLLSQMAGHKSAAELLLLGEEFSGADAARHGIVNAAVEDGAAVSHAIEKAAALARLAPDPVRTSKALLRRPMRAAIMEALDREAVEFDRLRQGEAAQAAFAAFFRKGA